MQRFFVEETRLGIPADMTNEGIRGLCHWGATSFPAQIGIGCTWDAALVREIGRATGKEARALGSELVDPNWPESELVPEPMSEKEQALINEARQLARQAVVHRAEDRGPGAVELPDAAVGAGRTEGRRAEREIDAGQRAALRLRPRLELHDIQLEVVRSGMVHDKGRSRLLGNQLPG